MKELNVYEKKLAMKYPKITCYNQHANLLSILSAVGDEYLPWLYNYYIQLQFANDINYIEIGARLDFENLFEWESCPFLYYQKFNRKFVSLKWNNIIDFIVDCIDNDYYLYLTVDCYYMDIYYRHYNINHFIHPLLIYGYNLEEKYLYIADNCKNGQYSYVTIDFNQFLQGYSEAVHYNEQYYLDAIYLVKYSKRDRFYNWNHKYSFDKNLVKSSIEDYLSSKGLVEHGMVPLEQWKRETLYYGVDCYNYIVDYLEHLDIYDYDFRTFFVLNEHKKIMVERIRYMQENGYLKSENDIYDNYLEIEKSTSLLNNLWLKYGFSRKEETVKKIIMKLKEIKEKEIRTLKEVLSNIV